MTAKRVLLFCILLATVALAVGLGAARLWLGMAIGLGIGTAWIVVETLEKGQSASIGLVVVVFLAAYGVLQGAWPVTMALALVAALSAWDIARFRRRLAGAGPNGATALLERMHGRRLLAVNGMGLLLSVLAASIHIRFGFFVALLGGLLVMYMVYRGVSLLP